MLSTNDAVNQYAVENGNLVVSGGLNVALTATAVVYAELPEKVVEFKYNSEGIRIQKKCTIDSMVTTTDYVVHGQLITEMRRGDDVLHFFYDAQSKPIMVEYKNTVYRYVHNLQGDTIGIIDAAGNLMIEYKYDAWGNLVCEECNLLSFLCQLNLFKFRSYVWDTESELYYLQSRYYSPQICRFVNCDAVLGINDDIATNNLFVYCSNNSVVFCDHTGLKSEWELLGFKYDGTASDFRRLEQGLPPQAYQAYVSRQKSSKVLVAQVKRKDGWIENKNKKKGYERRQPTGERERNVAHPNAEEHSRVPKGNRGTRSSRIIGLISTSLLLAYLVINDITGVGAADDAVIVPTVVVWWDYVRSVF